MTVRSFNLVAPLPHEGTAMCITDTAASKQARSGTVSRLARSNDAGRSGDVDSAIDPVMPSSLAAPGIRTSTTATRTGTTRTTRAMACRSADWNERPHADFSFFDLVEAYFLCRRRKRNTASAMAFELQLEDNLADLYAELKEGRYAPGKSICFVITRPKPREVWAAEFRDRIVHWLLYNAIAPRFNARFIADSCACIPGRGTHYGARRLEAKVRSQTENWRKPGWYLKMDLANFFVSIDKRMVMREVARHVRETWWLHLVDLVLFHDPRPGVVIQASPAMLAKIPPHKSLFNAAQDTGLPIGNLSSQFFANVLLDALDKHVKQELRVKHYIRYVDDFIILGDSPQQLNAIRADIEAWLPAQLNLRINPAKTILQPIDRGIDFAGYEVKPWRTRLRRRTFHQAIVRCSDMEPELLHQAANSYFGQLGQATHSHTDRAALANVLRRRGRCINHDLTQTYRPSYRRSQSA